MKIFETDMLWVVSTSIFFNTFHGQLLLEEAAWRRLLQYLIIAKLIKKLPIFSVTPKFITVFTRNRNRTLS
jgi:hypothetical protein